MALMLSTPLRALVLATVAVTAAPAAAHAKPASAHQQGVLRADLAMQRLGVVTNQAAETFTVTARVKNLGRRVARETAVDVALSADQILDADDVFMDGDDLGRTKPGTSNLVDMEVDFPNEAPTTPDGQLWILVCTDIEDMVKETSETNNCQSSPLRSEVLGFSGDDDWTDSDEELGADGMGPALADPGDYPADDPRGLDSDN